MNGRWARLGYASATSLSGRSPRRGCYVNELAGKRKPNTVRGIYSVLRAVLGVGVERQYLAVNPCDAVKLPRSKGGGVERQLFLSPTEVRMLADAAGEDGEPLFRSSERVAARVAARRKSLEAA